MNRRHHLLGAGLGLAAALLATPALAQRGPDDGEFVILQARYGTDANNVDVTDRLRQVARRDRRVQLTNELLGVDPAPGRDKVLRIYARDSQNRERRFEYWERSWVDGGQFVAWSGGRWGDQAWSGGWAGTPYDDGVAMAGQLRIVAATYGTPGREVDVTRRLRQLARQDEKFRMGNDTFGVDPDPGHTKRLRIVTRDPNGTERSFEYTEGSWVDGAQFAGWRRGDWG